MRAASRAKCSGLFSPSKKLSATRPPPPLVPRASWARVLRDDEDVEPGERLGIAGKGSVAGGDEDAPQLIIEAGAYLGDAGVVGAGGAVGALDELEFFGDFGVGGGTCDRVECGGLGVGEALGELLCGAAGDQGGGAGGLEQALGAEVVGVGEAGAFAREHADAAAYADTLAGGLDQALVDTERGGGD